MTVATPVQIKTMRQSTVSSAYICQQRIPYMFDPNIPKKGSVMRAIGTGNHGGLALYYEARRDGKSEPPIDEIVEAGVAAFDADVSQADVMDWRLQPKGARQEEIVIDRGQALDYVASCLRRYFENHWYWPHHYTVLAVEGSFTLPFPGTDGWHRTGTSDLVMQDTNTNWVHVVDHKTARKKWAKGKSAAFSSPQGAWYISAWQEILGLEHVTFTYDVQTLDGEFQRIDAFRTSEQVQATLEEARRLAELIDRGGPYLPNPSSFLCHEAYCDYWDYCPFGKTLHY